MAQVEGKTTTSQKVRSALLVRVPRLIWKKFVGKSPDTNMGDAPVTFGIDLVEIVFVVAVTLTLDLTLDIGTKELESRSQCQPRKF